MFKSIILTGNEKAFSDVLRFGVTIWEMEWKLENDNLDKIHEKLPDSENCWIMELSLKGSGRSHITWMVEINRDKTLLKVIYLLFLHSNC